MLHFKHRSFLIVVMKRVSLLHFKTVAKSFFVLALLLMFHLSHAQNDTTVVDTVSFSNIDSITQPSNNENDSDDEDEDDAYVDTTIKHIYDTSQYFFNWKEDFSQAYTKQKFAERNLIDKDVKELKNQSDFWYVPEIEKIEKRLQTDSAFRDSLEKAANVQFTEPGKTDFTQQTWFRFIIWFIIIGVFLAAIIYFLFQNKISLFSRESVASSHENAEEDENIFELSYNNLIHKAETEQNYRLAVRLMFLQTLKLLSETNHIKYQPDYTNLRYLQQLYQSKLYNDFSHVTRDYEYVWYGKFEIAFEKYKVIKNDFLMLQNKIA